MLTYPISLSNKSIQRPMVLLIQNCHLLSKVSKQLLKHQKSQDEFQIPWFSPTISQHCTLGSNRLRDNNFQFYLFYTHTVRQAVKNLWLDIIQFIGCRKSIFDGRAKMRLTRRHVDIHYEKLKRTWNLYVLSSWYHDQGLFSGTRSAPDKQCYVPQTTMFNTRRYRRCNDNCTLFFFF